ncbi:MAG: LPS export ABC transporter permease LptF [bacterium]
MSLLLHRYVLKELVPSFAVGLLVFTFVLLMDKIMRIVEWIVQKGVPLQDVLRMFGALLPNFLVLTLPTALLLSVLLTFSRINGDRELDALKSCGIGLYQLLPPVYLFGAVVCAACLFLTTWAVPQSMRAFQSMVVSVASKNIFFGLRERVFFDEFPGFVIYIEHLDVEQKSLEGIFISDEHFPDGPIYYFAEKGRIAGELEGKMTLLLEDGTLHRNLSSKEVYQIARFDTYRVRIDLGAVGRAGVERKLESEELTLSELADEARARAARGQDASKYWIKYHERIALPFGALVFCTLGVPLSLFSHRSGRYTGFTLSIVVVLAYFILMKAGIGLVQAAGAPAFVGAWLPNLALGAAGAFLLVRQAQEKPLRVLEKAVEGVQSLEEGVRRLLGRKKEGEPNQYSE